MGRFFRRYGWRAYALPVLVALTVLAIVQVAKPRSPSVHAPSVSLPSAVTTVVSGVIRTTTVPASSTAAAARATTRAVTVPGAVVPPGTAPRLTRSATPASPARTVAATGSANGLPSAALPPGQRFIAKGKGSWHVVPGTTPPMGSGPTSYTFTVEVENGIESAAADSRFAAAVDSTLADPRSWIGSGSFTLRRIDSGTPSFRISLTSQVTARSDDLCGWQIKYEASCYARSVHRVAINNARWVRGAVSFNGDRNSYRAYAINHEVGHALGYTHQPCPRNGALAPVMMQQSWSTADNDLSPLNPQLIPMDGNVCRFNPYPFPHGGASSASTTAELTEAGG